jgi:hypothetical protein
MEGAGGLRWHPAQCRSFEARPMFHTRKCDALGSPYSGFLLARHTLPVFDWDSPAATAESPSGI